MRPRPTAIEIDSLTLRYGERLIQRDLSFTIAQGDIFIIMGGSGCGKSTLLRHLIGLQTPAAGSVRFAGVDLWQADDSTRQAMQRRFGVLFQSGALWSSLTLSENIMLPMTEIGGFRAADARELAAVKLTAVPLTSARLHYKTAGIEAAQMLLNSIGRASNVPKIMKLDYEIVERESTNR